MELQWIDDFLALHQTQNFTRAAASRFTTQSAYSRRIQRLETWLGAPLFDREARPVCLTPAGIEFLARARRLRDDIFDARRATLSTASHFKQTCRIYTTNTIATSFLSAWIVKKKLENYSLIVASITGCLEAIRQKRADMALIPLFDGEEIEDYAHAETIGTDHLILVSKSGNNKSVHFKKNQLSGPLMIYAPGTAYSARIVKRLEEHRIKISNNPICESASAEALLAQVKAGLGSAWIPEILLTKDLKRCDVPDYLDISYRIVLAKPMSDRSSQPAR